MDDDILRNRPRFRLEIANDLELQALFAALNVANFYNWDGQSQAGSPLHAALANRVAALMESVDPNGMHKWRPVSQERHEWWWVVDKASRIQLWDEWNHAIRADVLRAMLAPLVATDEDVSAMIGQVEARRVHPDRAPSDEPMLLDHSFAMQRDVAFANGLQGDAYLWIDRPRPTLSGVAWYCGFQVTGTSVSKNVRYAFGIDAVQAHHLAVQMGSALMLFSEEARSGRMTWNGSTDLGLDHYLPTGARPLLLLGYWRDETAPDWPDPRDLIDPSWDAATRDAVVAYLKAGRVPWTQLGFSTCRICGKPNGCSELTDDTYVWPEGLAHYVADHGVRLPEEFVTRALDAGKSRPSVNAAWWRSATGMAEEEDR